MDVETALRQIADEFRRASATYRPLFHQQLLVEEPVPENAGAHWNAFVQANRHEAGGEWEEWHGPYQGRTFDWLGRFHGEGAGVAEFKQLADSLYSVLRKSHPKLVSHLDLDPGDIPQPSGHAACLELMHEIANEWPVPLLKSKESRWRIANEYSNDADAWAGSPETRDAYPLHPFVEAIDLNLFVAARGLIEFILDPDNAFFIKDAHFFEPPLVSGTEPSHAPDAADPTTVVSTRPADYQMYYLPDVKHWHVRFKHGPSPSDVLDVHLEAKKGLDHIAHMLSHPNEKVPCDRLSPLGRLVEGRSIARPDQLPASDDEPGNRWGGAKASREEAREDLEQMTQLRQLIREATTSGDKDEANRLQEMLELMDKDFNRRFDKFGRSRKPASSDAQRDAAKRVLRNLKTAVAEIRARAANLPEQESGLDALADHFERIEVNGTSCLYRSVRDISWDVRF